MDCCSRGVDRDNKICGGRGGSIIGFGHCGRNVTMESTTKWCEHGCHISVDLRKGSSDAVEGGVHISMGNGC